MRKLSCIICVGPKYRHKCPHKREVEGDYTDKGGGSSVAAEAEMGVMWLWAKERQQPPAGKDGLSPRDSGGSVALPTGWFGSMSLMLDFWPLELSENTFLTF